MNSPLVALGMALSIIAAFAVVFTRLAPLTRRSSRVSVPLPREPNTDGQYRGGGKLLEPHPRAWGGEGNALPINFRPVRPSVSVVVPTLNEAGCVAWVLERLPRWVDEVVLVDGLSTDETEVVARGLMADLIVVHQPLRGKGAAVRAGFAAATSDIIVMLDADGSTNPAEIERCVEALLQGAEFVKGSRYLPGGGSEDLSRLRSLGNVGFTRLVNLTYGTKFTDLCYGYCALWRSHVDKLALTAVGFEIETELVLSAVKAGLRVEEIPSFELLRRAGKSNLNAYRDGRRVLRTIVVESPGRRGRRAASDHQIHLVPVELPSPGTQGWVPAGADRRRDDRRNISRERAGYTGPERRRDDRRATPGQTVTVYRAVAKAA